MVLLQPRTIHTTHLLIGREPSEYTQADDFAQTQGLKTLQTHNTAAATKTKHAYRDIQTPFL